MEYVIVDLDVDILGIYESTIKIKNAGTDWGKGGAGSSYLHCLSFVLKRVTGSVVSRSSGMGR